MSGTPEPTLETPRLLLRPWRATDLDAYAAIAGDADVMRYVGAGIPSTRAESAASLDAFLGHWARHGYGLRAAVERVSGEVIGLIGVQRAGEPGVRPGDVEIGWRLARSHWGRGLASEGAAAVRDEAFGVLGLARLVAFCRPENAASIRVAERIGLVTIAMRRCHRGLPLQVLALEHAAWAAHVAAA